MVRLHRPDRHGQARRSPSASPASTPPCATATPASSRPWSTPASPLGCDVKIKWIDTTDITDAQRRRQHWPTCDGIIVPGGFGVRGTEGKIACIRYARENKLPYLGLCLGFQMAVIEFARNVCGLDGRQQHRDRPELPAPGDRHPARAEEDRGPRRQHAPGRQGRRDQARHAGRRAVRQRPADPHALPPPLRGRSRATSRRSRSDGLVFSGKAPDHRSCRSWNCPSITRTSSARRPTRA